MINQLFTLSTFLVCGFSFGQSFAPAAGQAGSTAIHKDSSIIVSWATGANLQRGYLNIVDPGQGLASFGQATDALGVAEGNASNVVSLGDSGVIVLTFDRPIFNESGPDFAVFENGFADDFLELAFVEVSSDGVHFVRFPAISETPTNTQIGPFDYSDCRYVHNLAGKYRAGYGTPFDLDDLSDSIGIDLMSITHVKLIDVVGTINPQYGSFDSEGTIINDLYPTEFPSGGFDLDAVGVINEAPLGIKNANIEVALFPNPTSDLVTIETKENHELTIYSVHGQLLDQFEATKKRTLSTKKYACSILFLHIKTSEGEIVKRVQVL